MIRTKIGMLTATGAAALAIGFFGGVRPANAATMNPQIRHDIRPIILADWDNHWDRHGDRDDHRRYDRDDNRFRRDRDDSFFFRRDRDDHRRFDRDDRRFRRDRDDHRDWDRR